MEETYTLWQQIADSRTVLTMFGAFIVVVAIALRPGSRKLHQDAAQVPFRHEDAPASDTDSNQSARDAGSDPMEART